MSRGYPLASTTWDQAEYAAIQEVIKTGHFTMGKKVQEFERHFAHYLGSQYCVMCSSGSTANLLMVAALMYRQQSPLKAGDEVIVPAVSWSTTYYPLHQYGLKIKFVDIDAQTLNYDLTALAAAISPQTKAIMVVNLLGNPNDFDAIQTLIKDKNILMIEDNCESLGATYRQRQTGTFGLMGTFSSFFSHHISTMEGGVVCTDDEELYHILLCLRAHGWTRNLPDVNWVTGNKSQDPFEESFKFVLPGYNVRPLEMSGAIGIEQLKKLPSLIQARRENASLFREYFGNDPRFITQTEISKSSWFGFSLVLKPDSGLDRKKVVRHLSQNKIECRPIVAGNFAKNPVTKWFDYEIHGKLTNADLIDQGGLFVGNHHYPLREELSYLHEVLEKI